MSLKGLTVLLLSVLVFYTVTDVSGQNRRKAERMFSEAKNAYELSDDSNALDLLNKCLQTDSTYADAWVLSGDINADSDNSEAAILSYRKAILCNPAYTTVFIFLAQNELKAGHYEDAKTDANKFLTSTLADPYSNSGTIPNQSYIIKAHLIVQKAEIALNFMAHPLPVVLHNIGPGINTP